MATRGVFSDSLKDDNDSAEAAHRHKNVHGAAEKGFAATDRYGAPLVHFDKAAEKRLRWKIDLMVIPLISILYLFCFIDRANIGNARLAGLEADLGMTGIYDYNTLLSIFYISYIIFEIPSNIACKWMGPGLFLPLLTLCFGITSLGTAFVTNLRQACGVRFLLGVFESGVMPGMSYYLSRWYRRSELTFRLSLYVIMAPLAGAFGGILASGILSLPNIGSLHRWRMIFGVEGIITIGLSLIAFIFLTDRPETARWLTQEEKDLAIARVKSERVAQTAVIDKIDKKKIWLGIWNPSVLATAWVFLLGNITVQGLAFFMPTIIATIYPKYSTIRKQLYTVPPYVVGAFFTLLLPWLGWRLDKRQIFFIISAPPVMIGYIMYVASNNATVRYAATFLVASTTFSLGALTNAQAAAQVVSDTSRGVSLAVNMMFGNVGGLIATWSYLSWDGPDYKIGNGLNLAASSLILVSSILTLFWMNWDNRRREKRNVDEELKGLTTEEIGNLEWRHPAWRWRP
ncbi:major facilitator superfamily domain-containing protein [Xylariales sp. AK1849]|nr:major facilitator superfamily domain-containing protein [Xylariales sp. AK1849]